MKENFFFVFEKIDPFYKKEILNIVYVFLFRLLFSALRFSLGGHCENKMNWAIEKCIFSLHRVIYILTEHMKLVMLLIAFSRGQRFNHSEMCLDCHSILRPKLFSGVLVNKHIY